MPKGKEYNGWNSYETWLVFTWLDNVTDIPDAASAQELVEEVLEYDDAEGFKKDVINSFLEEVDWNELAEAWSGESEEEEEDEEDEGEE